MFSTDPPQKSPTEGSSNGNHGVKRATVILPPRTLVERSVPDPPSDNDESDEDFKNGKEVNTKTSKNFKRKGPSQNSGTKGRKRKLSPGAESTDQDGNGGNEENGATDGGGDEKGVLLKPESALRSLVGVHDHYNLMVAAVNDQILVSDSKASSKCKRKPDVTREKPFTAGNSSLKSSLQNKKEESGEVDTTFEEYPELADSDNDDEYKAIWKSDERERRRASTAAELLLKSEDEKWPDLKENDWDDEVKAAYKEEERERRRAAEGQGGGGASSSSLKDAPTTSTAPKDVDTLVEADNEATEDEADEPDELEKPTSFPLSEIDQPLVEPHDPQHPKSRPNFPSTPNHDKIGPLVLDAELGIEVPKSINKFLRSYQREGVKFFYDRYKKGHGGLLGDDMGLGKTIQVIAFLAAIMKKTGDDRDGPKSPTNRKRRSPYHSSMSLAERKALRHSNLGPTCLLVAPASVCYNFEREIATWGYFEVCVFLGENLSGKARMLREFDGGWYDILITSYETLTQSVDSLKDLNFSVAIFDECHRIKTPKTLVAQAAKSLECQVRFGLSGTAVQNNVDEMWCVLDWCAPGQLGLQKEWKMYVTLPLKIGQSSAATGAQVQLGRKVAENLRDYIFPPFFLRRTKALIADQLPKKRNLVIPCKMAPLQKQAYEWCQNTEHVHYVLTRNDPCSCINGLLDPPMKRVDCHFPTTSDGLTVKDICFKYISIFRKISNHLALVLESKEDDTDKQIHISREISNGIFGPNGISFERKSAEMLSMHPEFCGKWTVLRDLLKKWHDENTENSDSLINKVLIFSQSVKVLKVIQHFIQSEVYSELFLHGGIPSDSRMLLIDKFQTDPQIFIMLVSTMAGGVGLNLTAANKVVIFDPSWNPAHDSQAMDRAFRMGQKRDVDVYRLLTSGSIESIIYSRQIYKRQTADTVYNASKEARLFEGVMGVKGQEGELFGLINMFTQKEGDAFIEKQFEQGKAELEYLEGDEEDDEEEELEQLIQGGPVFQGKNKEVTTKSSEYINSIWEGSGIQMIIDEASIGGPSKAEAKFYRNSLLLDPDVLVKNKAFDLPPPKKPRKSKSGPVSGSGPAALPPARRNCSKSQAHSD